MPESLFIGIRSMKSETSRHLLAHRNVPAVSKPKHSDHDGA